MTISRRYFLKGGGVAMLGFSAMPAFLARALDAATVPSKKVLVVIFQRGAMDGLNAVVPYGERNYYAMRPSIAIPAPNGGQGAAIDLDGFFGLHPSLAPLEPLFHDKQLAIVHAAGSPDTTRSHFDAQDYMESGTPGVKSTDDGWLNRYLQKQPEERWRFRISGSFRCWRLWPFPEQCPADLKRSTRRRWIRCCTARARKRLRRCRC